jgi:hypothetical protein
MTYKLATGCCVEHLEELVAELIAEGFRPMGGIACTVVVDEDDVQMIHYAQAMALLQ